MTIYKVTVDKVATRWYNEQGQLHREDGPAYEWADGSKSYWKNGKLHREDGPAVEGANGTKSYWLNGKLHREDGPAVERADGTKFYYLNGQYCQEQDFYAKVRGCEGKTVVIDGVTYKLVKQ